MLTLEHPTAPEMVSIAEAHLGSADAHDDLYTTVAELVERMRPEAKRQRMPVPSTAEYLDTLRACIRLNLSPADPRWEQMVRITLDKATPRNRWHAGAGCGLGRWACATLPLVFHADLIRAIADLAPDDPDARGK